jgi:hypothetical protein
MAGDGSAGACGTTSVRESVEKGVRRRKATRAVRLEWPGILPLEPLELMQPRVVPGAIRNSLKSLVFSCTLPPSYGIGRAKKSLQILKNRLEPFGQLRRLIGEQAEKAWITAPIGAHAPPIPCADQRDPPGFPRPGGSVFSPRVVSLAHASEVSRPIPPCRLAAAEAL